MNYRCVKIQKTHKDKILKIWADRMGKNYPQKSKLEDAIIEDIENRFGFVSITDEQEVVGFCLGSILSRNEAVTKYPPLKKLAEDVNYIGCLDTNVVKKSIENNGIGTKQLIKRENYFEKRNINTLFTICWLRDDHKDSSILFNNRSDFEPVKDIENYWYEETKNRNANCIDCGFPCTCTARIYFKKINNIK